MDDHSIDSLEDMIPDNLITPKGTNIAGLYRLCDKDGCNIYIMCPYVWCNEHDKSMNYSVEVPEYED